MASVVPSPPSAMGTRTASTPGCALRSPRAIAAAAAVAESDSFSESGATMTFMASRWLEEDAILPEQARLCTPPPDGLRAAPAALGLTLATAIHEHDGRCVTENRVPMGIGRRRTRSGREGGWAMSALIAVTKPQIMMILVALAAVILLTLIWMRIARKRKA